MESSPTQGKLIIRTRKKDNNIRIEFIDNGPGIPPDVMPKIFDPFFTTKEGGTGLGLSVSYGIVQEHGGRIWAESEPGKGATFFVELPLDQSSL
jgi:signal transduction histidine kinase